MVNFNYLNCLDLDYCTIDFRGCRAIVNLESYITAVIEHSLLDITFATGAVDFHSIDINDLDEYYC